MARLIGGIFLRSLWLSLAIACARAELPNPSDWRAKIYVPTSITKVHGHFMIVTCWQHRILYSDDLAAPVSEWTVLNEELAGPHSVAVKGDYLLTEDTGRDAVILYRWRGDRYEWVQRLDGLPRRPHRVIWDERTNSFWTVGCNSQTLYRIRFDPTLAEPLAVAEVHALGFQAGAYTRTMTIVDDEMYFVAGGEVPAIHRVKFGNGELEVVASYPTPSMLGRTGEMNDLFRTSDGWWYLASNNTKALLRARSLAEMAEGRFEDVKSQLGITGTPYYFSEFDGRIWATSIYEANGIVSFRHDASGGIADVVTHFMFGPKTPEDHARQNALPR